MISSSPSLDLPPVHPGYPDGARPTWELALRFPAQGFWTQEEYFRLDSLFDGGFRAELVHGVLEVLPMPTEVHQVIAGYLFMQLTEWTKRTRPAWSAFPACAFVWRMGTI